MIETLMTHARFDSYNQDIKREIIPTFWALKELNITPYDINQLILSNILVNYLQNTKANYKKLLNANRMPFHILYILPQIINRVSYLQDILQIENKYCRGNSSPLETLKIPNYHFSDQEINKLQPLLDGSKLQADLDQFIKKYPKVPADNLVLQMSQNCISLMLKEKNISS